MISSRSDYRFINQSSMNDIIIDGGIMPRRSSATKKILRGEDCVFVSECEAERVLWWKSAGFYPDGETKTYTNTNYTYSKKDFSNKLHVPGIYPFAYWYRSLFDDFRYVISSMPSGSMIVNTWELVDAHYDRTFVEGGYTLGSSDYESVYPRRGQYGWYIPTIEFMEGRFNNLSKVKAIVNDLAFSIRDINSDQPFSTFSVEVDSSSIKYGTIPRTRAVRVEVDGENVDVFSKVELWAIGWAQQFYKRYEESKSAAIRVSEGTVVREGGKTYVDFYIKFSSNDIADFFENCGLDRPSTSLGYEWYFFNGMLHMFTILSNRTKW